MAPQLALEEMGKAFAVMSYGDLAARCALLLQRRWLLGCW